MQAKIFGFKLTGIPSVPESDFCQRLANRSGEQFSYGGKVRTPLVAMCNGWLHATILTERPKRDQPVGEKDEEGNRLFRIEQKENVPDYHECTCIAFCMRRKAGVVASYQGGISIRQICGWLARDYRQMVNEIREGALASDRTEGPYRGMTDRDIKSQFRTHGTIRCVPLQEAATLQRTLEELVSISQVVVAVPEHDDDPAAPLRGVARTVDVVVNIEGSFRRDRNWRTRITELIGVQHASGGRIVGEDASGERKTLPINDEIFALDSFEISRLWDEQHFSPGTLCEATVFADLAHFMGQNPRLFGA